MSSNSNTFTFNNNYNTTVGDDHVVYYHSSISYIGNFTSSAQDDTCTRYGFDIDLPGTSCVDIYNKNPTSHGRSGYHVLKTDHLFFAYCDMELDCGSNKGGWMRIADINTKRGAELGSLLLKSN